MTWPRKAFAVPSPEQMELLRKAPPAQRLEQALALSEKSAELARQALRRIHPEVGEREVRLKFVELHYGREVADQARRSLADSGPRTHDEPGPGAAGTGSGR